MSRTATRPALSPFEFLHQPLIYSSIPDPMEMLYRIAILFNWNLFGGVCYPPANDLGL
jgi:hypothetical protein